MIDFAALPPEVNSARMHFGVGSETLVASAAAWTALATELGTAGAAFQEVTMALATGPWTGPSAVTMAAAAAPYVTWVMAEAALCGQRGLAATNAAMAFETARAGHIHPTIIASNRTELAAAVASNFLGVNSGLIAALEAQYGEFWAQDAAAMYGYAGAASALTGSIIPDLPAATTVNPAGVAAQTAEVGADAGQSAGNAGSTAGSAMDQLGGLSSGLGSAMNAPSQLLSSAPQAFQAMASPLSSMTGAMGMGGLTSGSYPNLAGRMVPIGASASGGSPVSASMGSARGLGTVFKTEPSKLSVPANWAAAAGRDATKAETAAATALTSEEETSVMAAPRGTGTGMMPAMASSGGGNSTSGGRSGKHLPRTKVIHRYL